MFNRWDFGLNYDERDGLRYLRHYGNTFFIFHNYFIIRVTINFGTNRTRYFNGFV